MEEAEADTAALRSEIKFWLDISKYFYRSFRLKRYLAPQWFLVNILALQISDAISVRQLLLAMPPQTQKTGGNSQVALSACLADLRSAHYVDLTLAGQRAEPKNSSFLADVIITRRPKLKQRAAKYVKLLLTRAYGVEYSRQGIDEAIEILDRFYNFSSTVLVRDWEKLLQDLARANAPRDITKYGDIFNELRGNLEYYIVLLSLWKARLLKDDEEGYEIEEIWAFHLATRHVGMDRLSECVTFLGDNGILEQVTEEEEEPRFRLAELSLGPVNLFGRNLLQHRGGLKAEIEKTLSGETESVHLAPS